MAVELGGELPGRTGGAAVRNVAVLRCEPFARPRTRQPAHRRFPDSMSQTCRLISQASRNAKPCPGKPVCDTDLELGAAESVDWPLHTDGLAANESAAPRPEDFYRF
jgi:hypothetical protein